MDYAASGEDWLVRRAALLCLRSDDERLRKKCAAAIRSKHSGPCRDCTCPGSPDFRGRHGTKAGAEAPVMVPPCTSLT